MSTSQSPFLPVAAGPAAGAASSPRDFDAAVARLRAAGCVFAEDEAALLVAAASGPGELERLIARRVTGVPLEHVVGWAEFAGQRFAVEENVFVPRHRTEFLVELAVDLAFRRAVELAAGPAPRRRPAVARGVLVVDLCCGSGALGAVVVSRLRAAADGSAAPGAAVAHPANALTGLLVELHAADLDPGAVRCARRNLEPLGGSVTAGDLYAALPSELRGRVDILVANAPYVPTSAIELLPPEFRDHEARLALDGGADGLAVIRRVLAEAADWLAPGGHLLVETSAAQAAALLAEGTRGVTCRAVTTAEYTSAENTNAENTSAEYTNAENTNAENTLVENTSAVESSTVDESDTADVTAGPDASAEDDTTVVIATRPAC